MASNTPTKPAKPPPNRKPVSGPGSRYCVSCENALHTAKYYTLDKESKRRKVENLPKLLSTYLMVEDVVRESFEKGLSYGTGHVYACETCANAAVLYEKTELKRADRCAKFQSHFGPSSRTSSDSSSVPAAASSAPSSPPLTPETSRQKRLATETPKKTVKRPSISSRLDFAGVEIDDDLHDGDALSPALSRLCFNDEPSNTQSQGISRVEVLIHYKTDTRKYKVPEKFYSVGHAIGRGSEAQLVSTVVRNFGSQVVDSVAKKINNECASIISNSSSLFKRSDEEALISWSIAEQQKELQSSAPTFLRALMAAAVDEAALKKAKVKSHETIIPGIMAAAGNLLYCRSSHANAHALMTALILRRGSAQSVSYTRLNHRGMCVSYDTVMRTLDKLGVNHDAEVLNWAKQVSEENSDTSIDTAKRHPGYQLVGDNLDIRVTARQSTSQYQGADYHMFNMLAIKNRISPWHLPDDVQVGDYKTISTKEFLPSLDDDTALRYEMGVLVGQMIPEYMPQLSFIKKYVPEHIPHEYSTQARKKSEVIPLGVIMENEGTKEGMNNIIRHLHKYTPGHDDQQHLVPIISAGDLMTCERECGSAENQRDRPTSAERFEGLQPHIADFHTSGNFMQAIWDALWDSACPGDQGALYPAKTRMKAKKVTADPMKSYNASEDLMDIYVRGLVIAAAMQFFGMDTVTDKPTKNVFTFGELSDDEESYTRNTLTKFVDNFLVPSMEDSLESVGHKFVCHLCSGNRPKVFVTQKGLKRHLTKQHPGQPRVNQQASTDDCKRNYCCNAMCMALIALDFRDARKHADGKRLLRIYKFLLLYFMAAGKSKYAFQSLRLLAAHKCFLSPRLSHELMWCRFVNTKGRIDSNIEIDRLNEHDNRNQKDQINSFHGKITEVAVQRVSKSSHKVKSIIDNYDRECGVRQGSGKHKSKEEERRDDVISLAAHYHQEQLFVYKPGRHFRGFPSFPRNYIASQVDTLQMQVWMRETLEKLAGTNMFQRNRAPRNT